MAIVFISGPMTGIPDYNRAQFNQAEQTLTTQGHIVLNPAWHPDGLTHDQYLHMCYAEIDVADVVVQLPGWSRSKGASREFYYAQATGKKAVPIAEFMGGD